jgi:hypothetical protein
MPAGKFMLSTTHVQRGRAGAEEHQKEKRKRKRRDKHEE